MTPPITPENLRDKLLKYAHSQGIDLNRNGAHVLALMQGLLTNEERYGYRSCPCRLASGEKESDRDIVCPCDYRDPDIEEFGNCYCGLYVAGDWNEAGREYVRIPERRPLK